jgi:fibronectin type 3 domain-containing protein
MAKSFSQANVTGSGFGINGLTLPLTLLPGQSTSFNVSFDPATTGSLSGTLSLVSDASDSPTTLALSGTGITHSVDLSWTASTSTVNGYNIYRSTQSGGPYTEINSVLKASTAYTDTAIQAGQTYYYVTTAVDASGDESGYSNEVMAVIPTP